MTRGVVVVVVCVVVCCTLSGAQLLHLYEDDDCKEVEGVKWTCKLLSDCPAAQQDLKESRKTPQICSFKGTGTSPIVCCEPPSSPVPPLSSSSPLPSPLLPAAIPSPSQPSLPSSMGIKSKKMCEEYAESVFIKVPTLIDDEYTAFDTCYKIDDNVRVKRITEGSDSYGREFPHMAFIGYQKEGEEIRWLCGGSLISDRFVLSTAHCEGNSQLGFAKWVKLGDYNVKSDTDEEMVLAQPYIYEIAETIIHPEYEKGGITNDIALYKLNASVLFTEFIRPVCLQTEQDLQDTSAIATGWGRTTWGGKESGILKKVYLKMIPMKECMVTYKTEFSKYGLSEEALDSLLICAGGDSGDSCTGDSGGPLQLPLTQPYCMYSQIGIISYGKKCGVYPGLYTRVSHYLSWIESTVWP